MQVRDARGFCRGSLTIGDSEDDVAGADVTLIGVDGGATEIKAHAVAWDDPGRLRAFELRPEAVSRIYPPVEDFIPVPIGEQLAQRKAGKLELASPEIRQGHTWIAAAVEAVVGVAEQAAARRVLVGVGMPGLKTADRRGICAINNGPRIPDFLPALEAGVAQAGIELVSPIAELGSDADYCGIGEEYATEGLFRDVENAYYVGCGTGIADAMKLHGRLVTFDDAKAWILKSWQIPSALGPTLERLVSAKSINRVFAEWAGATEQRVAPDGAAFDAGDSRCEYPEVAAIAGDPLAVAWLDSAALVLAELIFERMWTIRNGRPQAAHRGAAYAALNIDHKYRGTLLDRVVIGQRVGLMYGDTRYRAVFGDKVDAYLASLVVRGGDDDMADAYLAGTIGPVADQMRGKPPRLKPGLVRGSRLRAAPALGAAVAAARHYFRVDGA